jgi:hypothetical protein
MSQQLSRQWTVQGKLAVASIPITELDRDGSQQLLSLQGELSNSMTEAREFLKKFLETHK